MNILLNIPIYVFFIFFGLLLLGITSLKTKEKQFKITIILPISMLFLSLFGVYSLGISVYSLAFIPGIILGFFGGEYIWKEQKFVYKQEHDSFQIHGSVIPLVLMMIIFFTKFTVGILQARSPELFLNMLVLMGIITLYGIFSGIFMRRLYLLLELRKGK